MKIVSGKTGPQLGVYLVKRKLLLFLKQFLVAFANCEKGLLASTCLSVRPHGTPRLSLDGFSRNFMLEYFSKSRGEISSYIKV
jgi:hypothetical protein